MGRWLEHVRAQIPESPGDELTKPTKTPSVSFVSVPGEVFQKNQASGSLMEPLVSQDLAITLRRVIQGAQDWKDLEQVLARVQVAYEAGTIRQEQAERLAIMAAQEANCLPEVAGGQGKGSQRLDNAAAEIGD